MPRVSRKKRVLRTLDSTLHALQVLDFIFDDGADPYIEALSTFSSKLRYWMLRKNPDIPMNSLPRWFDTLYDHQNGRKFRVPRCRRYKIEWRAVATVAVTPRLVLLVLHLCCDGKLMSRNGLLLGAWQICGGGGQPPSKLNASYELLIGCRI